MSPAARAPRRILVVGGGGREHAIADALGRSPRVVTLFVAPGNAGTPLRANIAATDVEQLVALCGTESIDLVVIGPEASVEAGVVDALQKTGIDVFGPTRAAGRLEWSKRYCREFATACGLPSPCSAAFTDPDAARAWADAQAFDVVVKADGLAAGKGVVVPSTVAERDEAIASLSSTGPIVLEERLVGEEVSLLAFCDGSVAVAMPPAQDHKRIFEGDSGPNTGGMGVYAPAPVCDAAMTERIMAEIVRPTVSALADQGTPFVGVLFAGIMLTADGPKLLEFNCRFGDPETQALLPLLATPLIDVVEACVEGRLAALDVQWSGGACCAVVAAAPGYPTAPVTGAPITGLDRATGEGVTVYHAGTSAGPDGVVRTSGGRVLCVSALGNDLEEARLRAYNVLDGIEFDGKQVRRDIGWRALARTSGGYAASGVDIDAGNEAVRRLSASVARTQTPAVLAGVGSFGGAIDVSVLKSYDQPVLVASTDGVGTKVMLAAQTGAVRSVGIDIVNHCVDDVLVQRAMPLFFLDYIAASTLDPQLVADVVDGMSEACVENGCVLLGGETAEMPGVYSPGHFDIAGTLVGVAETARLLPRTDIAPGDVLIGLASNGPHTNGYSLLRRLFRGLPLDARPEGLGGRTLAEALLAPHRSYLPVLRKALDTDLIKGLAHITGGGLLENVPRVLPKATSARIAIGSWPRGELFELVRTISGLDDAELHRSLNMGVGMVAVCAAADVDALQALLTEPSWVIGEVVATEAGAKPEVLLT